MASEMCKYLCQKHVSVNHQMSNGQLSAHGYTAFVKKQRTVIIVIDSHIAVECLTQSCLELCEQTIRLYCGLVR